MDALALKWHRCGVLVALGLLMGNLQAAASPCLDAADARVIQDVADDRRIELRTNDNESIDMRGVDVRAAPSQHLIDFRYPRNICVTGGSAIAKYPAGFDVTWQSVKNAYDEGGFHTTHPEGGTTTFDRIYVEGVEDGLMIARARGTSSERWALTHSYFKNVIDDSIENDGFRSGVVHDSLFEGVHMWYSARNAFEQAHTLDISDSVIGFECKRDTRTNGSSQMSCPRDTSHQFLFKLDSITPTITMSDTIVHFPEVPRGGPGVLCLPTRTATYRNVTVVWTGPGAWPCPSVPGVTVTQDINVYRDARADWLARHGCSADGSYCAFLDPNGDVPDSPPDSPPASPILLD